MLNNKSNIYLLLGDPVIIMNNNKRPLTPKSMPPASDEHAKLKT